MGLFSAPAVSLVPGFASTAVRSIRAVGHRLDRTSRVTCCDASAVSRATEICGLFFSASACASLTDRDLGVPGAACAGACGSRARTRRLVKPLEAQAQTGRLAETAALRLSWAKLHPESAKIRIICNQFLISLWFSVSVCITPQAMLFDVCSCDFLP